MTGGDAVRTRRSALACACLASAAVLACGDPLPEASAAARCEGVATAAVSAADRRVLGGASPYPADLVLSSQEPHLRASMRARREAAWQVVERIVEPVPLAASVPAGGSAPAVVPRWHTWYGRDDLVRVFQHLYRALSADDKGTRASFTDAQLASAFAWNPRAVDELPNWPASRWEEYLASIDEAEEVGGVGGVARVGYAPGAARHLLSSYREAIGCLEGGAPAPWRDADAPPEVRVLRQPLTGSACRPEWFGPFAVASGTPLEAAISAPGAADVDLAVWVGAGEGARTLGCASDHGQPCAVEGPGLAWVEARPGPNGVDGATLGVSYRDASPEWAACLDGPFPANAAIVKADWRRVGLGPLATYDTSASGFRRRGASLGDAGWGTGDGEADPEASEIYTVQLANGARYRLPALHIMTKELAHWMWVTLWWSPTPDEDFGADRPESLAAGPWRHYKMCVVTAFDEPELASAAQFEDIAPTSLRDALVAAHDIAGAEGAASWCSNPYLEQGPGNAATSCVGCHQHGGSWISPDDVPVDGARFPAHGRQQLRNNFPADYTWTLDAGDELGRMFADEVAYWD